MSYRKNTLKYKDSYGTPTTPTTPTTPKPPSPKQPKIVQTTPAGTPVVSSGIPKEPRPSPRTEFKVGDVIVTGFQRTPTAIEADIQSKYREMTTGFAKTLGLDFNAMASSVKKIQSIFSQMEQNKQHMDLIAPDAFGRSWFSSQREDWYAHEEKNKVLEEELKEIQAQEVENQLMSNVNQISDAVNSGEIIAPDWFQNNIVWVQSGQITAQSFLDAYENLVNRGLVTTKPEPVIEIPELLPEVFAEEEQLIIQPGMDARVQIINISTGLISGEGLFPYSTIEKYLQNPNYRVVFLDQEQRVEQGEIPSITTADVLPPEPQQEEVLYPQSANVRISFTNSNIGMFSTSIPIGDAGQLQALSNESNEWKYTLIGSGSTNAPLMTLSDLINKINTQISSAVVIPPVEPPVEEPPVTTAHIPPPDMPVEEPPLVTAPTEPTQINWIPEPFFSFINSVFKK